MIRFLGCVFSLACPFRCLVRPHRNPLRPGKIIASEGYSRIIVPLRMTANVGDPGRRSTHGDGCFHTVAIPVIDECRTQVRGGYAHQPVLGIIAQGIGYSTDHPLGLVAVAVVVIGVASHTHGRMRLRHLHPPAGDGAGAVGDRSVLIPLPLSKDRGKVWRALRGRCSHLPA
jgi:hypothetical protein